MAAVVGTGSYGLNILKIAIFFLVLKYNILLNSQWGLFSLANTYHVPRKIDRLIFSSYTGDCNKSAAYLSILQLTISIGKCQLRARVQLHIISIYMLSLSLFFSVRHPAYCDRTKNSTCEKILTFSLKRKHAVVFFLLFISFVCLLENVNSWNCFSKTRETRVRVRLRMEYAFYKSTAMIAITDFSRDLIQ